jgi:hypothetical protein
LILKQRLAQLVQNFGIIADEPFGLEFLAESLVEVGT